MASFGLQGELVYAYAKTERLVQFSAEATSVAVAEADRPARPRATWRSSLAEPTQCLTCKRVPEIGLPGLPGLPPESSILLGFSITHPAVCHDFGNLQANIQAVGDRLYDEKFYKAVLPVSERKKTHMALIRLISMHFTKFIF